MQSGTAIFFITPGKDTEETLKNCSESAKNDGVNLFRTMGSILRSINGNISFTITNAFKFKHSPCILVNFCTALETTLKIRSLFVVLFILKFQILKGFLYLLIHCSYESSCYCLHCIDETHEPKGFFNNE